MPRDAMVDRLRGTGPASARSARWRVPPRAGPGVLGDADDARAHRRRRGVSPRRRRWARTAARRRPRSRSTRCPAPPAHDQYVARRRAFLPRKPISSRCSPVCRCSRSAPVPVLRRVDLGARRRRGRVVSLDIDADVVGAAERLRSAGLARTSPRSRDGDEERSSTHRSIGSSAVSAATTSPSGSPNSHPTGSHSFRSATEPCIRWCASTRVVRARSRPAAATCGSRAVRTTSRCGRTRSSCPPRRSRSPVRSLARSRSNQAVTRSAVSESGTSATGSRPPTSGPACSRT